MMNTEIEFPLGFDAEVESSLLNFISRENPSLYEEFLKRTPLQPSKIRRNSAPWQAPKAATTQTEF